MSIGEYAFSDCSSLTSITIPNSVKYIPQYCFWGCDNLKTAFVGKTYSSSDFPYKTVQIPLFSLYAESQIRSEVEAWQQKSEFETIEQWKKRVTENSRSAFVAKLVDQKQKDFIDLVKPRQLAYSIGAYDAEIEYCL